MINEENIEEGIPFLRIIIGYMYMHQYLKVLDFLNTSV